MPTYQVILTRPATASITVEVVARNEDIAGIVAFQKAGRYGENLEGWVLDEGNDHEVEITSVEEAE